MADTFFSAEEWLRYTRHIQLDEVGPAGQKKLKQAHVLIIGMGGLGAPVALYLAAAGVGKLTLVDGDRIELSNLQRQIVFDTSQAGGLKVTAAQQRLLALNPDIDVDVISEHLNQGNARALIEPANIVVDCTDNFTARYIINDCCSLLEKPWVFAGIQQFSGQCSVFFPGRDRACFRCLFPQQPKAAQDCNSLGVLGVLPGLLGVIQTNEVLQILLQGESSLDQQLLLIDARKLSFKKVKLQQDSDCLCCQSPESQIVYSAEAVSPVCMTEGRNPVQGQEVSPEQFMVQRKQPDYLVLDVRSVEERELFSLGGVHIPLTELEQRYPELDGDKTILCYCQSGGRSSQAQNILQQLGMNQVYSLRGGIVNVLKTSYSGLVGR